MRIYKYSLKILDYQEIEIKGDILSVIEENGNISAFTLANPIWDEIKVAFKIYTTHRNIEDIFNYNFINTIRLHNNNLTLHIFYRRM